MRHILAILDNDPDYAAELAAYADEKELTPFTVIAFGNVESLKDFISRQPVDILLNGTGRPVEEFKQLKTGQVIDLVENGRRRVSGPDGSAEDKGACGICRYQAADRLFREVMELYESRPGASADGNFKSEMIGVCSPVGRCGKTGFAITLGRVLAENCKVIYLNLEECSGLSALTRTAYRRSLSDVIYALRQGKLNEGIMGSAVYQMGKLDYVAPVSCGEDLEEIKADELAELAGYLAMNEHYEVLVMDIGNLGKNAFPLLERCGIIYAPLLDDDVSQARMAEWKNELLCYGGEDLEERVRLLHLPQPVPFRGPEDHFDSLYYGETGRLARSLLRESGSGYRERRKA